MRVSEGIQFGGRHGLDAVNRSEYADSPCRPAELIQAICLRMPVVEVEGVGKGLMFKYRSGEPDDGKGLRTSPSFTSEWLQFTIEVGSCLSYKRLSCDLHVSSQSRPQSTLSIESETERHLRRGAHANSVITVHRLDPEVAYLFLYLVVYSFEAKLLLTPVRTSSPSS